MKTRMLFSVLIAALFYCSAFLNAQEVAAAGQPEPIPGQYIVVMKDKPVSLQANRSKSNDRAKIGTENKKLIDASMLKVKNLNTKYSIQQSAIVSEFSNVMVGYVAKLSTADVNKLKADPNVSGVYQDYAVSLGPIKPEANPQDINAAGQTVSCAVRLTGGPRDGGANKSTWIWIADTGIDPTHPDLNVQTNAAYAKSFIAGQTYVDGHGHGTHVAGIAAAKNNGFGVVGVSAGATVVPVKVLSNSGSGTFSGIIAGLEHIFNCAIPGDVVNMSLGAYPVNNCASYSIPLTNAIINLSNAGVWVVMAAGNSGGDAGKNIPGCINGAKVRTVGALNCNKTCAVYSNWSSSVVDWAAVGSGVYSTYKGGGYATMSGTSMASPVVAGIIHARGGDAVNGGTVTCSGKPYKFAKL